MNKLNNNNPTTNERKEVKTMSNTFTELLRNYEKQARQRTPQTESDFTTALTELATACTFSVLKKLCNVGGTLIEQPKSTTDTTQTVRTLRQTLAKDLHYRQRLENAVNNSTMLEYNDDGELKSVVTDKDLYTASNTLCKLGLGDGLDLVNTAIITILEETKKADLSADFMEKPYTVRQLKKKVYIKDVDSLGGYETTETTAIQEVYKAIRRDIENSRTVQVASNKYTYLETIATDTEPDTDTTVYRRLPKYSGLAYETTDYNGKITAITADTETVDTTDTIIQKLNLSKQQATILQLRQSGYGYKAIATYLSVRPDSITKQIKRIREKALAIGLTPTTK